MTLVQRYETVQVGDTTYELGEQIVHTPELILALEATTQLVVARRLDPQTSELATMLRPAERVPFPLRPDEEHMKIQSVAQRHYDEYDAYLQRLKIVNNEVRPSVPVPPYIGTVRTLGQSVYFALQHLEKPKPTIHIAYDQQGAPLYRTQLAQIVE